MQNNVMIMINTCITTSYFYKICFHNTAKQASKNVNPGISRVFHYFYIPSESVGKGSDHFSNNSGPHYQWVDSHSNHQSE